MKLKQKLKYLILTIIIFTASEKSFSQSNNYPHGNKNTSRTNDRRCNYYLKNDTSDCSGKLMYDLKVDSIGNVVDIKLLLKTVPEDVEKKYREELIKMKFDLKKDYKETCKGKIRLEYFFTSK